MHFLSLRHYFLYLSIIWTDTALKVSRSLYSFTTYISHGVGNYFPRLWSMGISDAIFHILNHIYQKPKKAVHVLFLTKSPEIGDSSAGGLVGKNILSRLYPSNHEV